MTTGERLRAIRNLRGLTQDKLATLSGIPQPHISDIEVGKILSPTGETIVKLAEALGITTDNLLGYELKEEADVK